jgi:hypothetical protein
MINTAITTNDSIMLVSSICIDSKGHQNDTFYGWQFKSIIQRKFSCLNIYYLELNLFYTAD